MLLGMWKLDPALVTGKTVVYRLSSFIPIATVKLDELLNCILANSFNRQANHLPDCVSSRSDESVSSCNCDCFCPAVGTKFRTDISQMSLYGCF